MTTRRRWVISSPVGYLGITVDGDELVSVEPGLPGPETRFPDELLEAVEKEFKLYFEGTLGEFSVPVKRPTEATAYAHKVWDSLLSIPYGETVTYGQLAKAVGGSPRGIGRACKTNNLAIIIPCHRVVAASGLGGYGGDWEEGKAISVKKWLLEMEKEYSG